MRRFASRLARVRRFSPNTAASRRSIRLVRSCPFWVRGYLIAYFFRLASICLVMRASSLTASRDHFGRARDCKCEVPAPILAAFLEHSVFESLDAHLVGICDANAVGKLQHGIRQGLVPRID